MRRDLPTHLADLPVQAQIRRSPHRSTQLHVLFDIANLMDEHGRALVRDEELEHVLADWCFRSVKAALDEGRRKLKGHP